MWDCGEHMKEATPGRGAVLKSEREADPIEYNKLYTGNGTKNAGTRVFLSPAAASLFVGFLPRSPVQNMTLSEDFRNASGNRSGTTRTISSIGLSHGALWYYAGG
jgi:hypothetical protein